MQLKGFLRDGETTIKIKFAVFGGGAFGAERKIVKNAVFRGKRHDNKNLKVQILLSRNVVVVAQAPSFVQLKGGRFLLQGPRSPLLAPRIPLRALCSPSRALRKLSNSRSQSPGFNCIGPQVPLRV